MRKILIAGIISLLFISVTNISYADSPYVLPYPSTMPGSFLYKLHVLSEQLLKYWYFGNFGQFTYNLKLSDKYLVEAKTLFEYKQYLLADRALKKSDSYFVQTMPYLTKLKDECVDITDKKNTLHDAAQKHIETLEKARADIPESFVWRPEKASATSLYLQTDITNAIAIRQKYL